MARVTFFSSTEATSLLSCAPCALASAFGTRHVALYTATRTNERKRARRRRVLCVPFNRTYTMSHMYMYMCMHTCRCSKSGVVVHWHVGPVAVREREQVDICRAWVRMCVM